MDSIKSDMQLLLDSLKCSPSDKDQQIDALKTLAMLCNNDEKGDCIRQLGGLELISDIFCTVKVSGIRQWSLYALSNAIEGSVSNKRMMCNANFLKRIGGILDFRGPDVLLIFAANFLLSLCSKFGHAQDMSRETGCLKKLVSIFKTTIPKAIEWFDSPDSVSKNLWTTVSSTLCCMMSDPQNDVNKSICAEVLPQAINALRNANNDVVCSVLNFISHVVDSNGKTQRMLQLIGGLKSLVVLLNRRKEANDENDYMTSLTLQTISSGLTHYDVNREIVGSLGIIATLIDLIKDGSLSDIVQTSCLVCLSRCIHNCDANIKLLHKYDGIPTLVSIIVGTTNEEARRIAILIVKNSRISQRESVQFASKPAVLPSRRADKCHRRFKVEDFQAGRNGPERAHRVNSSQNINHGFRMHANGNEKHDIVSMLAENREILMDVIKDVTDMKEHFQEICDTSSVGSTFFPTSKQHSTKCSAMSLRNSHLPQYTACSAFDSATGRQVTLVPPGKTDSSTKRGYNYSSRGTSLISFGGIKKTRANVNRLVTVNIAKRAIMNAHEKSLQSIARDASKTRKMRGEDSTSSSKIEIELSNMQLGHMSSVDQNGSQIRKGEVSDCNSKPRGSLKKDKFSHVGRINSGKDALCNGESLCVEKDSFIERIQTENVHVKEQDRGSAGGIFRKNVSRSKKQRQNGLPTTTRCMPMQEQSTHERVQGWIDSSLPASTIDGDDTPKCPIVESDTIEDNVLSLHDNIESSDWENVSSIILSKRSDAKETCYLQASPQDRVESDRLSPPQSHCNSKIGCQATASKSLMETEAGKCNDNDRLGDRCCREAAISHSPIIDGSDSLLQSDSKTLNDSFTPPSIQPTRIASRGYKAKRFFDFKAENNVSSDSDESFSSIEVASEEDKVPLQEGDPLVKPGQKESSMCLGCYPFARFPFFVLNKRNCIRALQTDGYTCDFHKKLVAGQQFTYAESNIFEHMSVRNFEAKEQMSKEAKRSSSVCSIKNKSLVPHSGNTKHCFTKEISPPASYVKDFGECCSVATTAGSRKRKRKRQEYEEFEIDNICKGVRKFGRRWTSIINYYDFKCGRTAEDLKDKFKQLCKKDKSAVPSTVSVRKGGKTLPFSSEEIINLKTGYGRYGARWKTILGAFRFQQGRTAQDLKYRNKHSLDGSKLNFQTIGDIITLCRLELWSCRERKALLGVSNHDITRTQKCV